MKKPLLITVICACFVASVFAASPKEDKATGDTKSCMINASGLAIQINQYLAQALNAKKIDKNSQQYANYSAQVTGIAYDSGTDYAVNKYNYGDCVSRTKGLNTSIAQLKSLLGK